MTEADKKVKKQVALLFCDCLSLASLRGEVKDPKCLHKREDLRYAWFEYNVSVFEFWNLTLFVLSKEHTLLIERLQINQVV